MDKWTAVRLIVIHLFSLSYAALDITELKVPQSVSLSENKDIILDCVYEVTDKQGLVIKWFLDRDEQVYQWIPATRRPQAMGRLKDRLDLEYKATNDPYTMHRAMKIKEVTKELTGIYSCKVSSFENEDVESKKMVVYQPATNIDLTHDEDDNILVCNAEGVFPKPKMNIFIRDQDDDDNDDDDDDDDDDNNSNDKNDNKNDDDDKKKKKKRRTTKRADKDGDGKDDDDNNDDDDDDDDNNNDSAKKKNGDSKAVDIDGDDDNDNDNDDDDDNDDEKDANSNEDEDIIELEDDGTYNISSVYKYDEDSLKEPVVFICELYIPDTDYKILEKISYVPEDYQTSTSKSDTQLESSIANSIANSIVTNYDSSEEGNGAMTSSVSVLVVICGVAFTWRDLLC